METPYEYPPHEAKCPECDMYHGKWTMATHLQTTHGYDPEAAKYQENQIFKYAYNKWREKFAARLLYFRK